MDYRDVLKNNLSRQIIDQIADSVYDNLSNFQTIFDLIFDNDTKVAWRAAWACEKIIHKYPEIIDFEKEKQIIELVLSTNHEGLRRLSLSILHSLTLNLNVELINSCFDWLNSDKQPIAVQALSLKLLVKFCKLEPDLKPELIAFLENDNSVVLSPGMISCRRNAIKELNKNLLSKNVYK